jgi:hypothetical protein
MKREVVDPRGEIDWRKAQAQPRPVLYSVCPIHGRTQLRLEMHGIQFACCTYQSKGLEEQLWSLLSQR